MGLIRKSLSVGTVGMVKGSSKKQRVAAATMKAEQDQARALAAMAAEAAFTPEEKEIRRVRSEASQAILFDRQARKQAAKAEGKPTPSGCGWWVISNAPSGDEIDQWLIDHPPAAPAWSAPSAPNTSASDLGDQLDKLARLHDEGRLSDGEWAAAKAKLLR